ncbi:uncharacterized protein LOC122856320 [Aphidius gifuensis]|uniref:uncharacterized protein LOC122856320 n=1 Tax=Aphidius gifuensis TaxID=684658 RepID=UPI001CDC1A2C|nr:uncharacterized protein LOC122856320 [Aphidius gifuensis]
MNPTDEYNIEFILTTFWELKCVKTYNPFLINKNGKRGELINIKLLNDIFVDKLNNLYHHEIPISILDHKPHVVLKNFTILESGSDVKFCQYIANWLNFTILVKSRNTDFATYIVKLPNGSFTGITGDIIKNRSEFIGNSMHLETTIWKNLDTVYPYWRSQVVIVVPRQPPISGLHHLFSNKAINLWILITIGIIILPIFFLITHNNKSILLDTMNLLLFQNFRNIGDRLSEKLFCIVLIWWSFLITSIYQSEFIHYLAAAPYHNDIKNLQQLLKSDLTIMVKDWEYDMLRHSTKPIRMKLAKRVQSQVNSTECAIRLVKFRDAACSTDIDYAHFIIGEIERDNAKNINKYKNFNIHIVEEPLMNYWQTYVVVKNFPYLEKFNKAAARIVEFDNNKINKLEYGVFNGLTNLMTLSVSRNQLSNISRWEINYLLKLKNLNMAHNSIVNIEAGSFEGLNLNTLDLSYNKLHIIKSQTFRGLTIEYLDLSNNRNIYFQKDAFLGANITNLKLSQRAFMDNWKLGISANITTDD